MSNEFQEEFGLEGVIEEYIKKNLSIRLSVDEPGYYETNTAFRVELLLNGEVIDSFVDYVHIPR